MFTDNIYLKWLFCIGIVFYFLFTSFLKPLDGDLWIDNGIQFFQAVSSGHFLQTYVNLEAMHPGVSIMWIAGSLHFVIGSVNRVREYYYLFFALLAALLYLVILKNVPKDYFWKVALSIILILFLPNCFLNSNLTWLDGLSTPLIFLTVIILVSTLKKPSIKKEVGLGVLIGLLILTRYLYILLFPMYLFVIWLYYQKKSQCIQFIPVLCTTACVAFITFFILYPAAIANPQTTLFSRLNHEYSGQTIDPIKNSSILLPLAKKILLIHPLINFGFLSFLIELFQKREKVSLTWLLAGGGVFFLGSIYLIVFSLHDAFRGTNGFLSGFDRYITPAIFLLAPYSIQVVKDLRTSFVLKSILIILFISYSLISFPLFLNLIIPPH